MALLDKKSDCFYIKQQVQKCYEAAASEISFNTLHLFLFDEMWILTWIYLFLSILELQNIKKANSKSKKQFFM
jgi:hypothetical protein